MRRLCGGELKEYKIFFKDPKRYLWTTSKQTRWEIVWVSAFVVAPFGVPTTFWNHDDDYDDDAHGSGCWCDGCTLHYY
jgi:hypothetical protein